MKKSFTLIELMVVIGIIALLSTIGLTTYSNTQENARNTRRKTDLKTIESALNSYYSINGRYPSTCNVGSPASTCIPGQAQWRGTCTTWGGYSDNDSIAPGGYISGLAPAFMPKLPTDPNDQLTNPSSLNGGCGTNANLNCYIYRSTGTDFKLLAHCTPEGTLTTTDPFYDAVRENGGNRYTWQVSSSSTSVGW